MPLDTMRLMAVSALISLPITAGCTTMSLNPFSLHSSDWQMASWLGEPAVQGTPAWWKKHKRNSVFVPGKGYRVVDVEGYFDQEGRPIHTRVAKVVDQKKSSSLLGGETVVKTMDDIKAKVGMGPDVELAEKLLAEGKEFYRSEQYSQAKKCSRI